MKISEKVSKYEFGLTLVAAGGMVVLSAFHFWPFGEARLWRLAGPVNCLAWVGVLACFLEMSRGRCLAGVSDVSVLAYIAVSLMSAAWAIDAGRSIVFVGKLSLMLIGGYALVRRAIGNLGCAQVLYCLCGFTAVLCAGAYLWERWVIGGEGYGFFDNGFKFGTYLAGMSVLGGGYLLSCYGIGWKVFGGLLLAMTVGSCDRVGLAAGLTVGLVTLCLCRRDKIVYVVVIAAVVGGVLLMGGVGRERLCKDASLFEGDGENIRQRYLEWQAELNLLSERTVTGCGAGCVNERRGEFYGKLPKLNTIGEYDQNGWLTVAAETGLLGLVSFCWIVTRYAGKCVGNLRVGAGAGDIYKRLSCVNLAALMAMCVANLFCSVQYNGVLVVFAVVLGSIDGVENQKESV